MSRRGWAAPARHGVGPRTGPRLGRDMSRLASATIAIGMAASLAAGRASAAELSASEIAARNVAARGGLKAWRKIETMVWLGHIESARAPMPIMQFKLEQKRPNKTRLQILVLGDRSLRVFDGVHGWKVRPTRGRPEVQPYTPQELRFAQAGPGIDGRLIDYATKGHSVTLQGVDEIEGRRAYHLNVRLAGGGSEDVWVDANTYLDVRYDRMADGPGGAPRRVSATYRDYRAVEGVQIPFLIETGGGQGTPPDKMQIDTVVLNAPLAESTFGNPVARHALRRPWPGLAPRARAPTAPSAAATSAGEGPGATPP